MARKSPTHQLSMVLKTIQALGGSAGVEAIFHGLADPAPRRTLQRWLRTLTEEGRLEKRGQGPSTSYRIPISYSTHRDESFAPLVLREEPPPPRETEDTIPVTLPSREIVEYISRPLSRRHPVGYEREFLQQYEPNRTYYLGESLRRHLFRIGNTGELARPAGTYGRAVLNRLLIDLSWASSRLEGNTYTRLDTIRLIEHGERAEGKAAQEAQMILNHKTAIELLVGDIDAMGFNLYTFLNLHGALSENLLPDPDACGRLRLRPVDIFGTVYKPVDIPQVIDASFREILTKAEAIWDPFEQAFFMLVHLPYLQPFEDVNKRVSRLAANIPLLKRNLCPLTFLGVPEKSYIDAVLGVYEMNRVELLADVFSWAYERSTREYLAVHKNLSEPDPIRLRYRREIHEVVANVVRKNSPDALSYIEKSAISLVPQGDRPHFQEQVLDDLKRLHEGTLARYGLRLSEFQQWKQ